MCKDNVQHAQSSVQRLRVPAEVRAVLQGEDAVETAALEDRVVVAVARVRGQAVVLGGVALLLRLPLGDGHGARVVALAGCAARAGNRRFWLLGAPRAHTKSTIETRFTIETAKAA